MNDSNHNESIKVGDYIFGRSIGEGAFAKVRVGFHTPTRTKVAVKVIKKEDTQNNERFTRELNAFSHCDHPFIAKFFEIVHDDDNFYVIQELAVGGTLLDSVNSRGGLSEKEVKHYFAQMIRAIEYLHHHLKVMHRDIKAENVLLDKNNNIRLIDFGLCNILQDEDQIMKTACGSPAYAPPEMIQGKTYDQSAEVWSLGILLYAIANCELPFEDQNQQRLLQKIVFTEPKYSDQLSPELVDLLKKMLKKNPKNRITLEEIKQHPFIFNSLVDDSINNLQFLMEDDMPIFESLLRLGIFSDVSNHEAIRKTASYKILKRTMLTDLMPSVLENRGARGSHSFNGIINKRAPFVPMSLQHPVKSPMKIPLRVKPINMSSRLAKHVPIANTMMTRTVKMNPRKLNAECIIKHRNFMNTSSTKLV